MATKKATTPQKSFVVRIDKDLWMFLKNRSAENEKPISEIIRDLIGKYKKKCEK